MVSFLYKLGSWLLQKLAAGLLIVVLALAIYSVWLFIQDRLSFDARKSAQLGELQAERSRLVELREAVSRQLATIESDLKAQQEKAQRVARIIENLEGLRSWWERWFGNSEQQSKNERRLIELQKNRTEIAGKVAELKQLFTHTTWEREGIDIGLKQIERSIRLTEESKSQIAHYLGAAWRESGDYIVVALAFYFFGPTIWKVALFYGLAPWVSRGRPIRLMPSLEALPIVGQSGVSVDTGLAPGDVLRVKEKYLQASDEGAARKTRFVLDWKIPFTSVACGLIELVELANVQKEGDYRVTLSNAVDPHIELAIVHVPAGASLVLRPSYLAGVIQRADQPLMIRRRWQIWRWHSWIALQFRFFEFVGPCRLVVAGSRGVRAELLSEREGVLRPARRTNRDATIGFTPNLEYRPVRAETFWSYYRGMNPLFDDLFAGPGLFLLQETALAGEGGKAARFWSGIWNALLKVFGL